MKKSIDCFRQVIEIILLCVFIKMAWREWNKSSDDLQRVIVGFAIALLIGITNCCVIFRFCFKSQAGRFDFHITALFITILFINYQNKDLSLNNLLSSFLQLPKFQQIVYSIFLCLLSLNLLHYIIIGLVLVVVGVLNLIKIWISSDQVINVQGLTQLEFDSLPKQTIVGNQVPQQNIHAEQDCAICLSDFLPGEIKVTIVQCKHSFHSECIQVWFKNSVLCPYCRSDVRKALQRIKLENHIHLHKGTSYFDMIIEQAEPSFQLEEFINDSNIKEQEPELQIPINAIPQPLEANMQILDNVNQANNLQQNQQNIFQNQQR